MNYETVPRDLNAQSNARVNIVSIHMKRNYLHIVARR